MSDDDVEVRRAEGLHRFEIVLNDTPVGYTSFRESDGTRVFLHTEIDPSVEGRGLGGKLIRGALDQTRAEGLRVDPQCPFVRSFIEEHQEYADLLVAA